MFIFTVVESPRREVIALLSPRQYRKLRQISLFGGTTAKDYGKNKRMYDYLKSENFIISDNIRGYNGFIVTQKGYSAMYQYRVEHFRFWFPSIVSLLALAASILSLATTNPEFWQSVREWVQGLQP